LSPPAKNPFPGSILVAQESSPWTTLGSLTVYDGPLFAVRQDQAHNDQAGVRPYTWLRFKVVGIAVLPVDDEGNTYLIGQHRYPVGQFTWELVRGAGDLGQPEDSARRELSEETGFTAKSWMKVLDIRPSAGISDETAPCFIAWGLTQNAAHPDPQEKLRIRRVPLKDAVQEVLTGQIRDACSSALILAAYVRFLRGELPADLAALFRRGI
jgi:8-oxo-dGTP pyrophosphatase MutT (NUDIX family)